MYAQNPTYDPCQPWTFSPGSNPRERPGIDSGLFSPGSGAFNSIPRDADA
jgi:hypothetical protein